MKYKWIVVVFGLVLSTTLAFAAEPFPTQDQVKGGSDHPMLGRYSGSRLVGYMQKGYDETQLIAGPYMNAPNPPAFSKLLSVEGKITRLVYIYPQDRSGLEVMRNYRSALLTAGLTIIYECDKDACGGPGNPGSAFGGEFENFRINNNSVDFSGDQYNPSSPFNYGRLEPRYVLASLKRSDGAATYAAVYVVPPTPSTNGGVFLEIVEPQAMQTGKVASDPDADRMAKAIAVDGKVALYGIYFDTDKAEMRDQSKPTLDEIAKLMRQNPRLSMYVVGHTDNQGSYAHNLDLSQHRADAVVKALVTNYKLDAARLSPQGVASVAPAATNDTEEGRSRNRRVELVKQ